MPNPVELKEPAALLLYEFDWTDQFPTDGALVSVVHSAPAPLFIAAELTDTDTGHSLVEIGGGEHGGLYVVSAQATLTTGELIMGQFTMRVLNVP
jgi:hypothetical protein